MPDIEEPTADLLDDQRAAVIDRSPRERRQRMTAAWSALLAHARTVQPVPFGLLLTALVLAGPRVSLSFPAPGLDAGWSTGLNLARVRQLRYGRELVFTYGPWGFLDYPQAISTVNLMLGTAFAVIAVCSFWLTLHWVLRSVLGDTRAAVSATLVVALCAGPASFSALLLAAGMLALLQYVGHSARSVAHTSGEPAWVPAVVAGAAALLLQVKFSEGTALTAATICAVAIGSTRQRRLLQAASAYVLVTAAGWLLMGQSPADFPYWIRHSVQIATGYTDAMSLEAKPNVLPYLILLAMLGAVAGYLVRLRHHQPVRVWAGVALVAGFSLYLGIREGTGRHGAGQTGLGYFYLLPVLAWFVGIRQRPQFRFVVLAVITLVIGRVWLPMTPSEAEGRWGTRLQLLVDPKYREQQLRSARQADQRSYALSAQMRNAIGDHPTTVDPWEITLAWAYQLQWRPVPVFQDYSAYTAGLDTLNAASIASAPSDQQILRAAGGGSIDGRYVVWDSPRYVLAEVCGYRVRLVDSRWMLLQKSSNRCGAAEAAGSRRVRRGQSVAVPQVDDNSVVTVSFTPDAPNPAVRLGRLLDKSFHPLRVNADEHYVRLPRGLADGPLIVKLPAAAGWPAAYGGDRGFRTVTFNEPGTLRFSVIRLG